MLIGFVFEMNLGIESQFRIEGMLSVVIMSNWVYSYCLEDEMKFVWDS